MSFYSPINQKTLAETRELHMDRRTFAALEAKLGDIVKITGQDGFTTRFRIIRVSAVGFVLRPCADPE